MNRFDYKLVDLWCHKDIINYKNCTICDYCIFSLDTKTLKFTCKEKSRINKKNVNCAVLLVFDFEYSEVHVDFRSARSFIGIVLFVISGAVCDLTHCALKYLECLSISLYQKHGCIFHLFFPLGILHFSQRYITTVIILSLRFQVKTFSVCIEKFPILI